MKALIAIVITIGITAVAGAIFVGVNSFDGVVTEHPYEKGLEWDSNRHKKIDLGWTVEIQNSKFITGDNEVLISVFDKHHMPLPIGKAKLLVSRPATATFNKYFDIIQVRDGVFSSRPNFPMFGFWDIDISVSSGGDTLTFQKRVFVKNGGKTS
ncbi:MAG: FixH family protein [Nitrospirota bacterium]